MFLKSVSVIILLCVASTQAFYAATGCSLDLMEDIRHPVTLVYESPSYVLPEEKSTFEVNAKKTLLLYCPGPGNTFKFSGTDKTLKADCVTNKILQVSTTKYDFDYLNCTSSFYGDYISSNQPCGDGEGIIYQMGYNVPGEKFYQLYEVCHQESKGKTLYTQHEFRRYSKPDKLKGLDGATFQKGPFFTDVKKVYDKQNDTLASLLGKTEADKIIKYHQLSRGHLVPSADFVLSGNRRTTYQAVNTAPQWRTINEGNWNELEEQIRTRASKYHADLKIITGTYGVLTLPNGQGTPTEIYLADDKVPVPQIIWKVVTYKNQGIAFLSVNTPMNPKTAELCTDICVQNKWGAWTDYAKGRIYCCQVSKLKELVPYLPVTGITSVLQGD